MFFGNREDAGRRLAEALAECLRGAEAVILGIPRGGLLVAYEVARELSFPLGLLLVRKLGVPGRPELAMGAIGEEGARVLNEDVIRGLRLSRPAVAEVEARERALLLQRTSLLRGGTPRPSLTGRSVVVVDDGVATGATARAACQVARQLGATRVTLAIPVGPPDLEQRLGWDADCVVCLTSLGQGCAVGAVYGDFGEVSDQQVVDALGRSAASNEAPRSLNTGQE